MTIFGIVFFVLLLVGFFLLFANDEVWGFALFASPIITLGIFLLFMALGSINTKYEKSNTFGVTYIASLSANSGVYGHFCLGSGTVESRTYYYYLANNEFGYKICKIENDGNVYIREDNNDKPYIEYTKYNAVHTNWFGSLFFENYFYNKDGEIIIHVPKNTVVKNYNVDISKL